MFAPRAYIFYGLNAVRFLSIVALLLVFASSIFVMVTDVEAVDAFQSAKESGVATDEEFADCDYINASTVPNQAAGVFWAVVNRLLIIFQVIILILSEVGWPSSFFARYFPVLGPAFGLGALGIFECLLGAAILSHHVDDFTLVAAFFLFSVGCLNMVIGLIFRESAKSKRSIRAWRSQVKGILPEAEDDRPVFTRVPVPASASSSFFGGREKSDSEMGSPRLERSNTQKSTKSEKSARSFGFGRSGEKKAGLKGFLISRPLETLPRYAARPPSASEAKPSSPSGFRSSPTAL